MNTAAILTLSSALLLAGSSQARFLGDKKYGNFHPNLNAYAQDAVNQCDLTRVMQADETCLSLASQFSVSLKDLQDLNNKMYNTLNACKDFIEGSIVCIPTTQAVRCMESITTQSDDSCAGIGYAYGLNIDEINALNPNIICSNGVQAGTTICIKGYQGNSTVLIGGGGAASSTGDVPTPTSNPTDTASTTVASTTTTAASTRVSPVAGCLDIETVNKNTTCSFLASTFHVSFVDLVNWNYNFDCYKFADGDKVCVKAPDGVTVPKTRTTAHSSTMSSTSSAAASTSAAQTTDQPPQTTDQPPQTTEQPPPPQTTAPPPPPADYQPRTDDEARALNQHNVWRGQLGVPGINWSNTLADRSADWANYLANGLGCALQHSNGNSQYGENIFMTGGNLPTMDAAVDSWMTEPLYSGPNHATQVLWARSGYVGCARSVNWGAYCQIVVCRYGGPGNWDGNWWSPVYPDAVDPTRY
ncbi:hypothetical protein HDU76_011735 [Blyttiomyces sp. JEL0837]|nr:hypothetical protein HDU76_011735 [Blyttiomyces sp. JEL0837]